MGELTHHHPRPWLAPGLCPARDADHFALVLSIAVSASQTTRLLTFVPVSLELTLLPPDVGYLRRLIELTSPISPPLLPFPPPSRLVPLCRTSARPTCLTPLWAPQDNPRPHAEPTVRVWLPSGHQRGSCDPARRGRALPHRRDREHEHGPVHPARNKVSEACYSILGDNDKRALT